MMDKEELYAALSGFYAGSGGCIIDSAAALRPDLAGLRLYDGPLLGAGDAADPAFAALRQPQVVGESAWTPEQWLPGARTVLSFFLPFSQRVRQAHRADPVHIAPEWLHGRIQGQSYVERICRFLCEYLTSRGYGAVAPCIDPRFQSRRCPEGSPLLYVSNWSERHAAYICGLGTFSLTKGLITDLGLCGRFGSVITSARMQPDQRPYSDAYEYCIRCGACVSQCPAGAITLDGGKDHAICSAYQAELKKSFPSPYYGCGKCQVNIPCESCRP